MAINGHANGSAATIDGGQSDQSKPKTCPTCGGPLRGQWGNRCYRCKPGQVGTKAQRAQMASQVRAALRTHKITASNVLAAEPASRGDSESDSAAIWVILEALMPLGRERGRAVLMRIAGLLADGPSGTGGQ